MGVVLVPAEVLVLDLVLVMVLDLVLE